MFNRLFVPLFLACSLGICGGVSGLHEAQAADESVYAVIKLEELEWPDGRPPSPATQVPAYALAAATRASLDGTGDVFLETVPGPAEQPLARLERKLAVRLDQARDLRGTLHWPEPYPAGKNYAFRIPAGRFSADARHDYWRIRLDHFERLAFQGGPGAALYRHEVRAAQQTLGIAPTGPNQPARPFNAGVDADRAFELFSGERAIHENLQLDQQMLAPEPAAADVPLESLAGITVREFDWKPHIVGKSPAKDRLASFIPADQHAAFFPSFDAFSASLDALQDGVGPAFELWEAGLSWKELHRRYERQLGVALDGPARALGPQYIDKVALTGGDPYVRTGADMAILFQTSDAGLVHEFIEGLAFFGAQSHIDVRTNKGKIDDVAYTERKNDRRTISSYIARIEDVVVVANSLVQLRRIIDTRAGRTPPLADAPEFTFFRDRYPLGDAAESALVVISDQTIRRWCGPQWRIGAARRIRAAAVLAEARAARSHDILLDKLAVGPLPGPHPAATGALSYTPEKTFLSADYGDERFLTPISELEFTKVTKQEADRYNAWRDGYQRFWRNSFDPIALRLKLSRTGMEFDLTVTPLIDNTQYRGYRDLAKSMELKGQAGDPHPATLLHMVAAMNIHADTPEARSSLEMMRYVFLDKQGRGDPAKWMGDSIAVYFDDDPVWSKVNLNEADVTLLGGSIGKLKLPIAMRLEVKDDDELQKGLESLYGKLNQFIDGVRRDEREHRGHKYVRIAAKNPASSQLNAFLGEGWEVFSFHGHGQWLLSFNESLVQRAIDRLLSSAPPDAAVNEAKFEWLGRHVAMTLDGKAARTANAWWQAGYIEQVRRASYDNLPILNEWRRRYPDRDPVEVHARITGQKLTCPAGGEYVWDLAALTMQSTAVGHPDAPRTADVKVPWLQQLESLSLGLSFELDGLRARGKVDVRP